MNEQVKYWNIVLVTIGIALSVGTVAAQSLEDFVISGEAARNAKTRDEISLDTARQIADHCLQAAG